MFADRYHVRNLEVQHTSLVLACLMCFAANGQETSRPPARPYFEVASVKPVQGSRGQLYNFFSSGPRVRYVGYTVPDLIMEAYSVRRYQVTLAPSVVLPSGGQYDAYDVEAKAPGDHPCTRSEFGLMLQALLAERFKLQLHRAQKETPVYFLSVEKNGPKFKESGPDAVSLVHIGVKGRNQTITGSRQNMHDLAELIHDYFFRESPVLDRTGLTGSYDFTIEATPQFRMAGDDPDLENISVFTAVRQQLGLRLAPGKAPVDVLVVDRIETPSSN